MSVWRRRGRRSTACCGRAMLAGGIAVSAASAFAQQPPAPPPSASQVTPRTLAPPPQAEAPTAIENVTSAPPPEGAENLRFTSSAIVVEGGYPELERESAAIVGRLAGTQISVADFYAAAGALQALYAQAGYPLARVVVPEQRLLDGRPARIVVVDGFLESIDTSGVARRLRLPISRALAPLIGRRRLTFAELERRLTLAGNYPGASLRSALGPGREAGSARLVIESGHKFAGGSISFDDRTSAAFERRNFNYQLSLNSLLNAGEQLYAFVSADPLSREPAFSSRSPRSIVGGGIILPLGRDGLSLNLEATHSVTRPRGGFFLTRNDFDRYSMRISHPLILSRSQSLTITPSIELLEERQTLPQFGGFKLSRDRFAIVRLGAVYSTQLPGYNFAAGITVSAGRGDPPVTAPLSRAAAETNFSRIEANAEAVAALPLGFLATANLQVGLIMSGGLPNSELFSLDGPDAISTFTGGALSADEGVSGRMTLRRPIAATANLSFTPYLFAAAGEARFSIPTPFDTTRASAAGIGLETNLHLIDGAANLFAAVEYGDARSNGLIPDDDRIFFNVGLRF